MKTTPKTINDKGMGPEPTFEGKVFLDETERTTELFRALGWYNYYFTPQVGKPFLDAWLKENHPELVKEFLEVDAKWIVSTPVSLVRMEGNGWILSDDERNHVLTAVRSFIDVSRKEKKDLSSGRRVASSKSVNPHDALRKKVEATILAEMDELESGWFTDDDFPEFDLTTRFGELGLPAKAAPMIVEWLDARLAEYVPAYEKTDADLAEGYRIDEPEGRHLIGRIIKELRRIREASDVTKETAKRRRAAGRKKSGKKLLEQSFKDFSYMRESKEYGVVSVDPTRIRGASTVVLFNAKYRDLSILRAADESGFGISGSTIKNVSPDTSEKRKLRVPEEILKVIMTKGYGKAFLSVWGKLTTTVGKPNGRVGPETLVLAVVE